MKQSLPRRMLRSSLFMALSSLFLIPFLHAQSPLSLVCPPNLTLHIPLGSCDTAWTFTIEAQGDTSGYQIAQTSGLPSGSAFPYGRTLQRFTAWNTAGDTAHCQFQVMVRHNGNFSVPEDLEVYADANCIFPANNPLPLLTPPFDQMCTDSLIVFFDLTLPLGNGPWLSLTALGPPDINKAYAFLVRDLATNFADWGVVRLRDTIEPVLVCQDIELPINVPDSLLSPYHLVNTLGIPQGQIQAWDACQAMDTITFTEIKENFPCTPGTYYHRVTNRTWRAIDASGNTATCLQRIFRRREAADILFPPDFTATCAAPAPGTPVAGVPYTEVNGIRFSLYPVSPSIYDIFVTNQGVAGACGGALTVERQWRVFNNCAVNPNTPVAEHLQKIDLVDQNKPQVSVPAYIAIQQSVNNCQFIFDLPDLQVTDSCSAVTAATAEWRDQFGSLQIATATIVPDTFPGPNDRRLLFDTIPFFPSGRTTIIWSVADGCDNVVFDTTVVEVFDSVKPLLACADRTVFLDENGSVSVDARDLILENGTSDLCADSVYVRVRENDGGTLFYESLSFDCQRLGDTIPLRLIGLDVVAPPTVDQNFAPAQSAFCTIQLIIRDTLPVLCTAPPDLSLTCSQYPFPTDSMGLFSFSCNATLLDWQIDSSQFVSACKSGDLIRRVTASNGVNSIVCAQKITFVPEPNTYFVKFPRDLLFNQYECGQTIDFGEPEFYGLNCQEPVVTYTDELFTVLPQSCFKVDRIWRVTNQCLNSGPWVQVPRITNPLNSNGVTVSAPGNNIPGWNATTASIISGGPQVSFSNYWQPDGLGYWYRQSVYFNGRSPQVYCEGNGAKVCGENETNDPLFWNNTLFLPTQNRAESEADIRLYFKDPCSNSSDPIFQLMSVQDANYLLFMDLDSSGLVETLVQPGTGTPGMITFGNSSPFIVDENIFFDNRSVPTAQKYKFDVRIVRLDSFGYAQVVWNTEENPDQYLLPRLPKGKYRIQWELDRACSSSACDQVFTIENCCPAPAITCRQDTLALWLNNNGYAFVTLTDVLTDYDDYGCNGQLSLRKGDGLFPPGDNSVIPALQVLLACPDTGLVAVTALIQNEDRLRASCVAYVQLKDSINNCLPTAFAAGRIATYSTNKNVPGVRVFAFGTTSSTISNGNFVLSNVWVGDTIRAHKNNDTGNGVSAFDLTKISRHILGLELLEYPYQMIAADANRSNTITTFDIIDLRKIILGTLDSLPNGLSWRFIPSNFSFPNNQDNPFAVNFPEYHLSEQGVTEGYDFVAIKTGDLDYSITPNFTDPALSERSTVALLASDPFLQKGVETTVYFSPEMALEAFQGTLHLSNGVITALLPGEGMVEEDFALHHQNRSLSFAAMNGGAQFALRILPERSGRLQDALRLDSDITHALAFPDAFGGAPLQLQWTETSTAPGTVGVQIAPNPVNDRLYAGIFFNGPEQYRLRVTDARGVQVYAEQGQKPGGLHRFEVETATWSSGLYFLEWTTESGHRFSGKAVKR